MKGCDYYGRYLIESDYEDYDEIYEATRVNTNDIEVIPINKYKIFVCIKEPCMVNRDKDDRVHFEGQLYNLYLEHYGLLSYNDKNNAVKFIDAYSELYRFLFN